MKYYIASSWKNIDTVRLIWEKIREAGHDYHDWSSYGYLVQEIDEQDEEFIRHDRVRSTFMGDLDGLNHSQTLVMLAPCGNSSHIEAGLAFAQGKRMIHIGEIPRDCFYNIFETFYKDPKDFFKGEKLDGLEYRLPE